MTWIFALKKAQVLNRIFGCHWKLTLALQEIQSNCHFYLTVALFSNHGHNWPPLKIFSQQKICSNMPALGSELWPLIFSWHLHVNCKFFLTFKKTSWVSRMRLSKGLHPSLIHEIEPDKHSIYWMPRAWDNGRRWFPFEKLAEIVRDPFWWAHLTFIHLFILLIHNEYLIHWFKPGGSENRN